SASHSPLLSFSSFFFQCSGVPRDLPSFPTRRSSDLHFVTPLAVGALTGESAFTDLFDPQSEFDVGHIRLARDADLIIEFALRIRSEEHTSELQSLTNLVCRLLLEKKKKVIDCNHIAR